MGFVKLAQPIAIGTCTYNGVFPCQVTVDRRLHAIEAHYGLVEINDTEGAIVGKERITNEIKDYHIKEKRHVSRGAPMLDGAIALMDVFPPHPEMLKVWEAYDNFLDALSTAIVTMKENKGSINSLTVTVGEEQLSVDVTDEARGSRNYVIRVSDERDPNLTAPDRIKHEARVL